ncbi:hypothetical protein [Shewanella frigidimarina]|uniref:hypothetical protein n=1 Tax=Shewanella frigidimarina TaxID=56812 RepID=UPI003D7A8CD5
MIEIIITDLVEQHVHNNLYAVKAPKDLTGSFIVYSVQGFNSQRDLSAYKQRSVNIQLNVFADSYKQAKQQQQKIIDLFEDFDQVIESNNKSYTIQTAIQNIIDLTTEPYEIAIDITVDYIVSP